MIKWVEMACFYKLKITKLRVRNVGWMIRRSACGLRLNASETNSAKIQLINKHINDANWVIFIKKQGQAFII
jgi:hypothetical protein